VYETWKFKKVIIDTLAIMRILVLGVIFPS